MALERPSDAPRYDPAFLAADAPYSRPHPRVHVFPFLDPAWCEAWSDEIERRAAHHAAAGGRVDPPNGLHEYGVVLAELGYGRLLDELLDRLRPLAALVFPEFGGATLDHHHGFLVDYSRGRDEDLPFHVDDSEVTLNLCLAGEFAGSELYFEGLRCDAHRQSRTLRHEHFALEHEPGLAVLHAGVHRHGVDPLRHGQRRNLILWCRELGVPRFGRARPLRPVVRRARGGRTRLESPRCPSSDPSSSPRAPSAACAS